MRSKKSIYFKTDGTHGYVHLFRETLDDSNTFQFEREELEKISRTTVKLKLDDMIAIGKMVDFDQLKKQAFLTDEEIEGFCLSISQKDSSYFEKIFKKYKEKRNELANIIMQAQKSKVYPIEFGLEEITSWKQQNR